MTMFVQILSESNFDITITTEKKHIIIAILIA